MRIFISFFWVLLLSGSAFRAEAQAVAPPVAATAAPTDTVAAVQRLFSKRRTGGTVLTVIGAAFTGSILGGSIGSGFDNPGGTVVGIAVLGGVPGGIGISKLARFSKAREAAVLDQFRQTHKLPPYVQKRLKTSYFQP